MVVSRSAAEVTAEPRRRPELHPVGHLVDRDPETEVARRQTVPLLDLQQVRSDEVQQALVVGRQERVVLAQDAPRDVAEERTRLRAERLPPERAVAGALREDAAENGVIGASIEDVHPFEVWRALGGCSPDRCHSRSH